MDYYDAILALIPLTVGGISIALLWTGVTMPLAVSAGTVVGAGLIGHGMFIRAPVSEPSGADAPSSPGPAHQSKTGEFGTAD